jgi:hypothetical protein
MSPPSRPASSPSVTAATGGLDYDDVLAEVGQFGRWQIFLFALLWIPSAVSAMQELYKLMMQMAIITFDI